MRRIINRLVQSIKGVKKNKMRYAQPLQSEFHERNSTGQAHSASTAKNLFVKRYPTFFKREDVRRDFVAVQHELQAVLPFARVIKEDVDTSFAHVQFDVATSDEVLLEKILAKRGFIKA